MKKITTNKLFIKFLIAFSMFFFVYKNWDIALSQDESKLIQLIFERVLMLTPSNQQWTGEFVVNIFSLPLEIVAVFSPAKFSSMVSFWLDYSSLSFSYFRVFYYLLVIVFVFFINTPKGLLSALIGCFLMEYLKIIPEFRLEVLLYFVLVLSIEKKSIWLFCLAISIKLLTIIFLPWAIIAFTQNTIKANLRKSIVFLFVFNSSIVLFPALTAKAFLGDIYLKLFAVSTANFSFLKNGIYPFSFFIILALIYRKEIYQKWKEKKVNRELLSILSILFYCLLFIKLTGYSRYVFILLPFVLLFLLEKIKPWFIYLYSILPILVFAIMFIFLPKLNYYKFNARFYLTTICNNPDYAVDTFLERFKQIPKNNFFYKQILDEEKRNAQIFLDNY